MEAEGTGLKYLKTADGGRGARSMKQPAEEEERENKTGVGMQEGNDKRRHPASKMRRDEG